MKDLTTVQHYFLPKPLVIIAICCRKLHAIVIVEPVCSCVVVSAHLKSVVVAFISDGKITKINTKSLFVIKLHQRFSICVCVCVCVCVFTDISGWLDLILVLTFDYLQFTFWMWQITRSIRLFCHK